MIIMNNIYALEFEVYLISKGYDLDTISLKESLKELAIFNKIGQ